MTNDQNIQYGDNAAANRAIHSALSGKCAPQPGHKITKDTCTWYVNGTLETYKAYEGETLLFTITFTWNVNGTFAGSERTDNI
jgi:hypothetical protein